MRHLRLEYTKESVQHGVMRYNVVEGDTFTKADLCVHV